MNILDYWRELGIVISAFVGYLGGLKLQKINENKEGASAIEALQRVYDNYIEHDKTRTDRLIERVEKLEIHNRELQKQFNTLNINYNLVLEQSNNWEKKYSLLETEHTNLKSEHDKLKLDFDKYKKINK